ncbi:hypothetical protein [Janthinobacterium agaricidamnosum]|uniref:hypothetical protein n=1 Tax=Janthinobacterium agaricidamnosum TaxID=55508 RepID=UPI0005719288|nr:hypothetical protein [Janthinobacterium agaricidamnosum]
MAKSNDTTTPTAETSGPGLTQANSKPESGIVLAAPYSELHVTAVEVRDHARMRARQLSALLVAMQPEDGPCDLLWLAQQMADEIVVMVANMAGGAA